MDSEITCLNRCSHSSRIILCAGFSLIELMAVLLLASVIFVFAVPSFKNIFLNARITSFNDNLFNSISFARLSAIKQKTAVQICPFNGVGATSCGGNWSAGWVVLTQPASGTPVILSSYQTTASDPVLSSSNGAAGIVFSAQGFTTGTTNMKICDTRGASFARSLMVLPTGYVQFGGTPGQAVWNNAALSCP